MKLFRIGAGFTKEAKKSLEDLKEVLEKFSGDKLTYELDECPLSIVVSSNIARLTCEEFVDNLKSLNKTISLPIPKNMVVIEYN